MEWLKFWQRGRKDRELAQELSNYLEQETADNVAAGMSPADARDAALRKLGNTTRVRETVYEDHSIPVLDPLWRDVRYGLRQLRRTPAFTIAAVLSLALGIGANTSIFQLLNALSLRSLPVNDPGALVEIRFAGNAGRAGRHTGRNRQLSYPQWQELQRRQEAFTSVLAFGDTRFNLAPQGEVRYVEGLWVSGSFFETLGVQPLLGRLFTAADDRVGCGYQGAVVSHAFWERELGGATDVLARRLTIADQRVPIIGVTPPEFYGVEVGRQFDVALPICAADFRSATHWWLAAIGRLKPGWTDSQAHAHVQGLMAGIQRDTLAANHATEYVDAYLTARAELVNAGAGVSPLREGFQQPLWVLLGIAGLVLLIAAVNLANLLLARASARQREFAIRLAIGGSRGRILQQVFTESLLLSALGAIAALSVASAASQSIVALISTPTDRVFLDLTFDWRVFGFTTGVAMLAALIFGVVPAFRAVRAPSLRTTERGTTGARESAALRHGLVALQVAVTLVLLFSALLFLRTLRNLTTTETGLRMDGLLVVNVFLREADSPLEGRLGAYQNLMARLRALPGVIGVAEATRPPLSGSFSDTDIRVDGKIVGESNVNRISAGYFKVMGTAMLAGRDFNDEDTRSAMPVAIVTETFANRYLDGRPIGRVVGFPMEPGTPDRMLTIVGLVKDMKYYTVREAFAPLMFLPTSQEKNPDITQRFVLSAAIPTAALVPAVKDLLSEVAPRASVRFASMQSQADSSLMQERLMARLAGLFGIVALALAFVGLYGVVAYTVARRRSEIGLRVALGAARSRIVMMMLSSTGRMVAIGVAIGSVVALGGAGLVGNLLYGVEPRDSMTLLLAIGVMVLAAFIAALVPARRAASIDPVEVLRET